MGAIKQEASLSSSRPALKRRASAYTTEHSYKKLRLDYAGTHLDVPPPSTCNLQPFTRMPFSSCPVNFTSSDGEEIYMKTNSSLRPVPTQVRSHRSPRPSRPHGSRLYRRNKPHSEGLRTQVDVDQLIGSVALTSIEEQLPIIIVTGSDDEMDAEKREVVSDNKELEL